jgi:hypothetical protein
MEDFLINVPESAHRGFLDRETVVAQIDRDLKPWCNLILDITNYGSNLIPRCFVSSPRGLKDAIVLAVLLRQVVATLDGIHVLLSSGACFVAQLPARALFESSAYIHWILLADSDKRSLYYYVHNLRRKRLWAKRMQAGSPESAEFLASIEKSGLPITDEMANQAKEQVQELDELLSKPPFANVSADFDRVRGRRKYDPAWYVPLGPRNLGEIAEDVNRRSQHAILYSVGSQVMHASSYEGHIAIGKGNITFQPVRSLQGFDAVLRPSLTDALATYRRVLEAYRPEELLAFRRKYTEKWQRLFLSVPTIKAQVEPISI